MMLKVKKIMHIPIKNMKAEDRCTPFFSSLFTLNNFKLLLLLFIFFLYINFFFLYKKINKKLFIIIIIII